MNWELSDIQKRDQEDSKVPIMDIEIKWSVLWASNSKVTSSAVVQEEISVL